MNTANFAAVSDNLASLATTMKARGATEEATILRARAELAACYRIRSYGFRSVRVDGLPK